MSLALIRDLAQAGVKVVCCERSGVDAPLGFRSKYISRAVTLPAENWLDTLYDLCAALTEADGTRPALLPVGAATLGELARDETRTRFSKVCGLCIPTTKQLDDFNSKAAVSRLGQALGLPVPRSFAPEKGQSPEDFAARLPLPCVIKPLCGEKLGLPAAQRYAIVRTPEEAAKSFRHFLALAGEAPVVQEYLPGGGLGCSVLANGGQVVAALCHRRVREYPVSGGPSACCDCVDRPDLVSIAAALVAETGYTGLAMFEFKEGADGAPRLLEINPRVWGTFPLTRVSGSHIPLLWCTLAWNAGNPDKAQPLPPVPTPALCRMHFAPSDLMSAVGYLKRGQGKRAVSALADFLRPCVRDGLWEWGDPKPGLLYYRSLLRKEKP
jgi:predicted ATP-grasp superfamily ATP-dependent carboligase